MCALALQDSQLLDAWDRAASLARPWRELALLESASGLSANELATLSIGERDRLLLALRIGTFGNRLECETRCPSCELRLELQFDAASLLVPVSQVEPSDLEMNLDDSIVRFRLPTSDDIASAIDGEDLASRLVVGEIGSTARLRDRMSERIAELDPQANISLDLNCGACGHRWQSEFDPAAFLFREVETYAARLANEVHLLARAYAWSEESILAMSATRRRRYLDLVLQ
jgi:hypothetical protein